MFAFRSLVRPRRTRLGRAALLVLTLIGAGGSSAAEPEKRFTGSATTTLIEVPVNVVGRDGHPLRDLEKADFELWEDGKPQPIDGVEMVDLTRLAAGRGQEERLARALPGSARRRFLLLFDFTFSNPNSVTRAREAARKFVLEGLHPTDLAAVATFSIEQGPRLLVTFTADRGQLARAVDTLGVRDLTRRGFLDPLRFFYEAPDLSAPEDLISEGRNKEEVNDAFAQQQLSVMRERDRAEKSYARNRIAAWSRAMGDLARSLGATAGRKHVVLFTEGFDGSLVFGRDASRRNEEAELDQQLVQRGQFWLVDQENTFGSNAIQTQLQGMLEEFRRADAMLQVVDLAGLRTEASTTGSHSNSESRGLRDKVDALFYLANTTGGTLFEQGNDVGVKLGELLDRSNVTYVLTFYPKDLAADGRFRKLRVRLRDGAASRSAKLSYRTGYYAPKPYGDLHPLERSLLAAEALQTLTPKREIELRLLAAAFRSGGDKAYVPVVLEIGGESLLAGQKGSKLGLEVYVYASTLGGEMRDFRTQVLAVDLERQRAAVEKQGIKYYAHLDLPPGELQLRVLVRNSETGRTAVASQSIDVPRPGEIRPELLPPFFLAQPGDWLMLREQTPAAGAESTVYPFTLKGEPFVPAALPRLERGKKSELCLVAYQFGKGELALKAQVKSKDGQAQEGRLDLQERTETGFEGLEKILATFDPENLEAGEYTLEVTLENTRTGLAKVSTIPFLVG